jgi:hypothetical protein
MANQPANRSDKIISRVELKVTPVLAEGLASLYNLIKQDAHTLYDNETSIQRPIKACAEACRRRPDILRRTCPL